MRNEYSTTRQVAKNGFAVGVRIIISAAMTFLYYRFLLVSLGPAMLGAWSLVLAVATLVQFAGMGLPTGLLRGVAALEGGQIPEARALVHTCVLTVLGFLVVFFPLALWGGEAALHFSLSPEVIVQALPAFPIALIGMCLAVIGLTYQSVLDGRQKFTVSSWIVLLGNICFAASGLFLVPRFGLLGLGTATIVQYVVNAGGMMIAVARLCPDIGWFPSRWDPRQLRRIYALGLNLQAISIAGLFTDPLGKMLIGKFGVLADVGYYELATKLTNVVRQVLVSVNGVVVPVVAQIKESTPERMASAYRKNYQSMLFLSVAILMAVAAFSQFASVLWIGSNNSSFVLAASLLAFAWMVNAISSPAYFFFFGRGELGWCTLSHILTLAIMFGCGLWWGGAFGYAGAVLGIASGLTLGSLVTIFAYNRYDRLRTVELAFGGSIWPVLAIVMLSATLLLGHDFLVVHFGLLQSLFASVIVYLFLVIGGAQKHPGANVILDIVRARRRRMGLSQE